LISAKLSYNEINEHNRLANMVCG